MLESKKPDEGVGEDAKYVGGLVKRVSNFEPGDFRSDFRERKKFQKTVYMMQAFDLELGYTFNWYIEGVYCPYLADVGYDIADNYQEIDEVSFTESKYEEKFEEYLDFIEDIKNDMEALEIVSSLHYIWVRNKDSHRDVLINWLMSEKDQLNDREEIEDRWHDLVEREIITE